VHRHASNSPAPAQPEPTPAQAPRRKLLDPHRMCRKRLWPSRNLLRLRLHNLSPQWLQPARHQRPALIERAGIDCGVVQPAPAAATQPQPASAQPAPAPAPISNAPETAATVVQPAPTVAAQPEPASAQPGPAETSGTSDSSCRYADELGETPPRRCFAERPCWNSLAATHLHAWTVEANWTNVNGAMGSFVGT